MKAAVVKKLFDKHLQTRLDGGSWLQKKSIIYHEIEEGLLRGFHFNSSGYGADAFQLYTFVQPLYVPKDYLVLTFGHTINGPDRRETWKYDPNDLGQLALQLAPAINKAEKDYLSKIRNAGDFYEYYKKDRKKEIPNFEAVAYSAAYKELKVADESLNDLLSFMKKRMEMQFDWAQKTYADTEALLKSDPQQRKHMLDGWAQQTQAEIL